MKYAHSNNEIGDYHALDNHLVNVATLSREFLANTKLERFAYLSGLFHDLGKINPDFQKKLKEQSNNRVDHKGLGVAFARKLTNSGFLCRIIAAHHGGLKNFKSFENNRKTKMKKTTNSYIYIYIYIYPPNIKNSCCLLNISS